MMLAFSQANLAFSHPLRLSLGEIEYFPEQRTVSISLRLFLMDVNEALVFDPESDELRFGQPDEAPHAERLLKAYLDQFFFVEVNGERLQLDIKSKTIKGQGIDAALRLSFEVMQNEPPTSIRIKNAVFYRFVLRPKQYHLRSRERKFHQSDAKQKHPNPYFSLLNAFLSVLHSARV